MSGKLVVGFSEEDKEKLIAMKEQGEKNGVKGLEIIGKDKIKEIEPNIDGEDCDVVKDYRYTKSIFTYNSSC